MLRVVIEIVAIFLSPFLIFFLYRLIRPDDKEVEDAKRFQPYIVLAFIGILLVAASLIIGRLMTERHTGVYVPATVKDGVVQPGRVE
jgi:amino acid transporter